MAREGKSSNPYSSPISEEHWPANGASQLPPAEQGRYVGASLWRIGFICQTVEVQTAQLRRSPSGQFETETEPRNPRFSKDLLNLRKIQEPAWHASAQRKPMSFDLLMQLAQSRS